LTWFKERSTELGITMESLYKIAEISRQGYYAQRNRNRGKEFLQARTIEMIEKVREEHPRMGARVMYYKLQIKGIGVNKFEQMVSLSGLGLTKNRTWIKTTNSNHNLYKYPNLTYGLELTGIDQLWVSDITYWITPLGTLYLVFIQDVYSRRILGYSVCDNMYTINNIKALNMAFKVRLKNHYEQLIHHSDKGSQYCSSAYISKLQTANITISMANNSLENPYAERLNGTIKNDYLKFCVIARQKDLKAAVSESIYKYNYERPHSELGYLTPVEYEKKLQSVAMHERKVMILHDFRNNHK
jgi:transposase InsO family protein